MDKYLQQIAREASFTGSSGHMIAYRAWRPAMEPAAIVLMVHGFNSHSAYFDSCAKQLVSLGIACYGVDLRGRGKSDGKRFFVETFDDYISDVEGLMTVAKSDYHDLPVFVLGHCAGGVVSCLFALRHQDGLAGLICESFAFKVPYPDFVLTALKGVGHIAPRAKVLTLKNSDFSRDAAAVARMDADHLIARESQPARTVAELVRANERLEAELPGIRLPLLVLHGTADAVATLQGSQHLLDHAGSADKTLKLYDGQVHDLLNDIGKGRVVNDISTWIERRLA